MIRAALLKITTAIAVLVAVAPAFAEDVTLSLESWRNDDVAIWQDQIIPAFEAKNPGIKVKFVATMSSMYASTINSKLDAGSAGDLITCMPFDNSLALFKKGHLAQLNDLPGLANFSDVAKSAWSTDDGKTTFCVPMASVIHGFIYNKDAFAELGLSVPDTEDKFFATLDAIKKDGRYIPMSMGTSEQWEAATMGYQNIGPNFWKGEEGRLALIAGKQRLTDEDWVEPFKVLARWAPYLPEGYQSQTYADSQNLFTLGRAAIYPAGSWEIAQFTKLAQFKLGAFPPPVRKAGDACYISDHTDIGMGMNTKTTHPEAARKFLEWVASDEFATLYGNALPGFFPLTKNNIDIKNDLAREFLSWRGKCKSTIRSTYAILSRGTPNLENETWSASASVINGTETPEKAAAKLQTGLDSWYKPAGQ